MPAVDLTRVGTNIGAMYSLRSLMEINNKLATAQQRLATGKRINSAEDDPAGMTIASKMKSRSIGLGVAQDNISDAKNMLAVAEDGLVKLTDILSTMRSKAQQAASDTLGSEERATIAGQLQQYARQIDDLVEQTQWNGEPLLDVSSGNITKQFQTGVEKGEDITWTMASNLTADALGVSHEIASNVETLIGGSLNGIGALTANTNTTHELSLAGTGTYVVKVLDRAFSTTQGKLNLDEKDTALSNVTLGSGLITDPLETGELASGTYTLNITNVNTADPAHVRVSYDITDTAGNKVADVANQDLLTGTGTSLDLQTSETNGEFTGVSLSFNTKASDDLKIGSSKFEYINSNGAKYELMDGSGGVMNVDIYETLDQAGTHQAVSANVASTGAYGYYNMDAIGFVETGRGIAFGRNDASNTVVEDYSKYSILREGAYEVDVSSASAAADYMDVVNYAMDTVNSVLADLGSLMARLTIKEEAAGSAQINVEAAYNRIMNANMAEEQVNASKYQVLQQTAVAMLAQANQAPQFLLSLFK